MLNEAEILENITELKNLNDDRKAKYRRNYRRYNYTPFADMENIRKPMILGYYQGDVDVIDEEDTTITPDINVIKSIIDTLTSKIAQSKVRPFFNCVNGTFNDIQSVKQAQQFFDIYFDFENVNKTVSECFRDGCIFDHGAIFIDPKTKHIIKALPWQVYTLPSEHTYNKLTRAYYEEKEFPIQLLNEKILDKYKKEVKKYKYVTVGRYFDTFNHVQAFYVQELNEMIIENYSASKIPFVFLWYNVPIHGATSESVVDMLNPIQLEIDTIMARIKDASQLTPCNTVYVPEGSNIKVTQLSNRSAQVIHYRPTPSMTSSPVTVSTPSFISEQYIATLERLKQNAYELVGISQLSAMSAKPTGLNSGIALQSMENIESDRFETQLNQVIRCYVDIAKICIDVFPKEEEILPTSENRKNIKWENIVNAANLFSIQFSGADSLSKDPSTKLEQLQQLAQSGIIPKSRIAQFLEIPDLNSGYSLANNAINAVMNTIENCMKEDNYDIPYFLPYAMLKEEIINTQLSLASAGYERNKKDIEKLQKLFEKAEQNEIEWTQEQRLKLQSAQIEQVAPVIQEALEQQASATNAPNVTSADLDVLTENQDPIKWQ